MADDQKTQYERFQEAARALGADDDADRFNEKLGKLVKKKPDENKKKKKRKRKKKKKKKTREKK